MVCLSLIGGLGLAHGQPTGHGRLLLSVLDPTDALIPHAVVHVARVERAGEAPRITVNLDKSEWTAIELPEGQYRIRVGAVGFREVTFLRWVRSSQTTRLTVRLALERVDETVIVSRDRQTSALDPRGFSTFLSREQIEALPDDPDELARVLRDMAPPGAVIRIDGFAGGPLPSKAQILSIRIPRMDAFPAEEHGGLNGGTAIDIVTRPGGGDVQGSVDLTARHSALNARNPLADSKPPAGTTTAGFTLDGPVIRDRVSFALSGRFVARSDTATLQAVVADGSPYTRSLRQPGSTWVTDSRLSTRLPADHTLRAALSIERRRNERLGVGDYNLEERAFDTDAFDTVVRIASGGPWGGRRYVESRMQLRWGGTRNTSATEAPAMQVLGAFTSGGAQVSGGARTFELQAASDVDYAAGPHAWRTGVLLDTASYQANRRANYLGTYTFTSLADYQVGRPAFYTLRVGDARIAYRDVQAGAYVQDDYRVRRSLLLSYGVRTEWQNLLTNGVEVLPRAALTWSPTGGTPAVRLSWGRFRDWFPSAVHERILLVDGQRQVDFRVNFPAFPVADVAGAAAARERVLLEDAVRPAMAQRMSVGVEHQFAPGIRLSAVYAVTRGAHLLRGHNLNPVTGGTRADEVWGNVVASASDAESRTRSLTAQVLMAPRSRWIDGAVSYLFNRSDTNTAGPFAVPGGTGSLDEEWGPTGARHAIIGSVAMRLAAFSFTVAPRWRSGMPYTITAGDSNDGLFTTRPPGVSRNSATTPPHCDIGVRIAYTIRPRGTPATHGTTITLSDDDPASAARGAAAAATAGRRRLELFAAIQNLTNYPNYAVVGSVVGSPLFGKPLAAGTPRSIDVGARVGF